MKVFNSALLLFLLSIEEIVCLPTGTGKAIHLPLQLIKRKNIEKRSSGVELPVLNDADLSELAIQVNLGTSGKQFTLLFDTGSADTWVPSVHCSAADGCPDFLNRYDPSSSGSYQPLNEEINISYYTASAAGTYFTDQLSLSSGTTLPNQTMALMNSTVGAIATQNETYSVILDGVFGAGLPAGTVRALNGRSPYDPVPVSLYKSGLIPQPVFSVSMGSQETGKVVFGDILTDNTNTPFVYSPLVTAHGASPARWTIHSLGFQFQNKTTARNFRFNQKTPVAIDTGTNLMYLPSMLAKELAHTIAPGQVKHHSGLFEVDCGYQESNDLLKAYFPNMDGKSVYVSIPISKLVAKRASDGICFFLFTPADGQLVFGNMFLRHFVVVYDFGSLPRIGLAPFVENQVSVVL